MDSTSRRPSRPLHSEFRVVLDSWVDSRRRGPQIAHYTEASEFIDWPNLRPPPQDSENATPGASCETTGQGMSEEDHQRLLKLVWTRRKDAKQ